jgi:hypothetical protein
MLNKLAKKYSTDKGSNGHNYVETYSLFFDPIRNDVKNLLEIGIDKGASIKMWLDYFPNAVIYGVDILKSKFWQKKNDRFIPSICRQDEMHKLDVIKGIKFDIIIDDGSHAAHDQQITFQSMFDRLNPGGLYVIEDLHTKRKKQTMFRIL